MLTKNINVNHLKLILLNYSVKLFDYLKVCISIIYSIQYYFHIKKSKFKEVFLKIIIMEYCNENLKKCFSLPFVV